MQEYPGIIYDELEGSIHRITFTESSRPAVTSYIHKFLEVNDAMAENGLLRLILDFRQIDAPPFRLMAQVVQENPARNDIQQRIAHLYRDDFFLYVMQNLVKVTGLRHDRKFFKENEEDKAIAWLLRD